MDVHVEHVDILLCGEVDADRQDGRGAGNGRITGRLERRRHTQERLAPGERLADAQLPLHHIIVVGRHRCLYVEFRQFRIGGQQLVAHESQFVGEVDAAAAGYGLDWTSRRMHCVFVLVGSVEAQLHGDAFLTGAVVVGYFEETVVRKERFEIDAAHRFQGDAAVLFHNSRPRRVHLDGRPFFHHGGCNLENIKLIFVHNFSIFQSSSGAVQFLHDKFQLS